MQFSVHTTPSDGHLWQAFHWNNIHARTCCSFIIHTIGGSICIWDWFVILQIPEVSDQEVPEEEQSSWLAARRRQHQGELRAPLLPDQSGWRGGGGWRLNWHFVGLNKFCLQYKALSVFSEVFSRLNPYCTRTGLVFRQPSVWRRRRCWAFEKRLLRWGFKFYLIANICRWQHVMHQFDAVKPNGN